MTNARKISALIGATVLASLFLAGCSEGSSGTATPSTSPSETTTSPSPSATTSEPPSESEVAEQAAGQVVRDYFATVDRLRREPDWPLSNLKTVAISGQLAAQEIFTSRQREAGNQQSGSAEVLDVVVQSVNLDNSDPSAGRVPTAQVDVCWDVSQVDVVDRRGKSIITADRPDRGWTRYTVANHRWKAHPSDGWRVSSGKDLEKEPCSAA